MKTILLALMLVAGTSCARKFSFLPSTVLPTAKGTVKITGDKNDNYTVKLRVTDIVKPKELQPSKENYIVWTETLENRAHNLGRLETSKNIFSKTRKAELESITAAKPVRVFITGENDNSPEFPSEVILTTKLFKWR